MEEYYTTKEYNKKNLTKLLMQADLNVPQAFTTRFTCSSILIFSIWMHGCQLQGPYSIVLIVKQLFISQSISSHIL